MAKITKDEANAILKRLFGSGQINEDMMAILIYIGDLEAPKFKKATRHEAPRGEA